MKLIALIQILYVYSKSKLIVIYFKHWQNNTISVLQLNQVIKLMDRLHFGEEICFKIWIQPMLNSKWMDIATTISITSHRYVRLV